ncbi:MAG: outer membrane beta-barrel protein [Casimicrobiaceae bacterium]
MAILALSLTQAALAQQQGGLLAPKGFYGGVALRDAGVLPAGIDFSAVSSSWAKFGSVMDAGKGSQSMLYGGFHFAHNVSVEAALVRSDNMTLPMGRGMGLALGPPAEAQPARWNADVYSSYTILPAFSLYGRLGYKQIDALPAYLALTGIAGSPDRQGVNYGVGLRYDMTRSLGLKLEYARFGRFSFDGFGGALPDSDQVQIGVQYRF